jgi:hypothetical protein
MLLLAAALDLKVRDAALTVRRARFGIAERELARNQKAGRRGVDGRRSKLRGSPLHPRERSSERVSVNEEGTNNWFWGAPYIKQSRAAA